MCVCGFPSSLPLHFKGGMLEKKGRPAKATTILISLNSFQTHSLCANIKGGPLLFALDLNYVFPEAGLRLPS